MLYLSAEILFSKMHSDTLPKSNQAILVVTVELINQAENDVYFTSLLGCAAVSDCSTGPQIVKLMEN